MFNKQILAFALGLAVVVAGGLFLAIWSDKDLPNPALPHELIAFEFMMRPQAAPQTVFQDEAGEKISLADFKGRVLLVNLWATWCAPCVEELPALDRLKQALSGTAVEVLAISLDADGVGVVREFYDAHGIGHLDLLNDESMAFYTEVEARGLPITLIILPDGKVLGRLTGTADWDAPAVQNFLLGLARN
ncbi:MAG: TlpA family protein disulfide reductase [Alphaproteobacteria bacterium]|nr:MAG: TlpA family protein disulfide reductase [Alphaproteobacteria bacterium]